MTIPCEALGRYVSFLEQLCTRRLPPLSVLEHFFINEYPGYPQNWQDNTGDMLWPALLLRPFPAVTNLYLCEEFVGRACPARAHWEQNDRNIAHPAEHFSGGARAIRTCPGRHSAVCFQAAGRRSNHNGLSLGPRSERNMDLGVND